MPDNFTGGFFANMIYDNSKLDKTNELNKKLWYVSKHGAYLVLKRFSEEESKWITEGLKDPKTFRFSDNGNLACINAAGKEFTYRNVLDTNTVVDFNVDSIADLQKASVQYVYDDKHVITRNLRFILVKDGAIWKIIYNPIHTKAFKEHYVHSMSKASSTMWGATTMRTDKHPNLKKIIQSYCDDFVVSRPAHMSKAGKMAYLDPVCNIMYSQDQCQQSSLFDDNLVTHNPGIVAANSNVLKSLGSGDPVPTCACTGRPYNYLSSNLSEEDDVAFEFLNIKDCDPELEMNICNVVNQASTLNISGSSISTKCGSGDGTPPPEEEEEEDSGGDDPAKTAVEVLTAGGATVDNEGRIRVRIGNVAVRLIVIGALVYAGMSIYKRRKESQNKS